MRRQTILRPPGGRLLSIFLRLRTFEALHHRQYRLLWFGQIFVSMGTWMDEVTRGWLIYELTNSAVQLGLVRGIQAIPFLLFSPLAGSAADRYGRKTQLVVAQVANGLLYAATALLIFTDQIKPWHVYITAFLMAIVQTFQQPARASLVSDAVPAGCLTNAIGLNAMVINVARSVGPALAGILIAIFGTGSSYVVQSVFFFFATGWTLQVHVARRSTENAESSTGPRESIGRSIVAGWKFSWRNEAVRMGLITSLIVSLFVTPFTTLLPVFARDLLGIGATGQGMLLTAIGIGALCSAVIIASVGDRLPRGVLMLGSVMLYGCILMIFAASPWFQLSLVMMGIAGLCTVHSNALVQTVIQFYSPSEYRGRTMALFYMHRVVVTVGSMLVGALSSFLGPRWAVASTGAMGTLAMIIIYVAIPRARLIR
ncbi:MAG: MFS transporter [Desulfobacterales bacterium]|nr:MFS transporter [Desulfobacterales bacterium]